MEGGEGPAERRVVGSGRIGLSRPGPAASPSHWKDRLILPAVFGLICSRRAHPCPPADLFHGFDRSHDRNSSRRAAESS